MAKPSSVRRLTRRVAQTAGLLLFSGNTLALQPTHLTVRSWSQGADVRQRSVGALLETRDGYLWLGTAKGLMRFDGVNFTAFTAENTPGAVDDYIGAFALWEDGTGTLWAGTESNGVIRNDHGHFTTLGKAEGLGAGRVLRIDGDETGAVWIYTEAGVNRWRNGHLEEVHPEQDGTVSAPAMLLKDQWTDDVQNMGLWRHTSSGMERFAYGHWNSFPVPKDAIGPFESGVRRIYEDTLHRVWYSLSSQGGRYYCVCNGSLRVYEGLPATAFVSYEDKSGFLWLNDSSAHAARWKDGKLYPLEEIQSPRFLRVLEQVDGMIWAGSTGTPLFQYLPQQISSLPTAGIPEFGSVLFRQRSGDVWAGGTNLLHLQQRKDGPSFRPVLDKPKPRVVIQALSEDAQGSLLITSNDASGIKTLRGGKLIPAEYRGLEGDEIRAMLLSFSGDQWIGTDRGLYRYIKDSKAPPQRLWSGQVRCLLETGPDTVWVGTAAGPLRFEDGRQEPSGASSSWNFGTVQSMSIDSRGELWMATFENGVVHFSGGAFHAFGTADGLPTNNIAGADGVDGDDLWLRSDVGLIRVRRRSIEQRLSDPASKLRLTIFDQADGLPAPDTSAGTQGFLRLNDDIFWFATPGGIASLRPAELIDRASPLHALLEEHAIDQFGRLPGSQIILKPEQSNLELHYTALGSRRPEQVNFRYRMRGYDPEWISAGNRRVAYYTHLPPGDYTFEVQAAEGDDEIWETLGASADVRVLTPFYRTWWMKSLFGLSFAGGLFFFSEARRRVDKERNRMRQAFTHELIATQEGERKRIAHELHDSLGQHLALIRTLALLPTPQTETAGDHLNKIADQSAVAIREIESISYDLRPYQLDRLGLTAAILSLTEHVEANSSIAVTHSVDNLDGFFPKHLEINVYRIVQEALANILKHAVATEVAVTASRTGTAISLVVTDNGRGFTGAASGSGRRGLGLIGIQERAEALGGHAIIESVDRQGTKVTITVTRAH